MMLNKIPEVNLYSDGGAEPNPGKGGFGVIMTCNAARKEFSQGYVLTTNNRMELMGVIHGLERLVTKCIVNVFSDSRYVIDGIEKGWAIKWKSNNWYRTKTDKAMNHDLWDRLLLLISLQEKVTFYWVKGHDGHTENERCDKLASAALNGDKLLVDTLYQPTELRSANVEESGLQERLKYINVKKEGDLCRKCDTKVIKKQRKKKTIKPGQTYYFEYYLFCPNCKTIYMVEDAKRVIDSQNNNLFRTLDRN